MTVRGSQAKKPDEIEFAKTTVYVRKNIKRIEETEGDHPFVGWEYDEKQYSHSQYMQLLNAENLGLKEAIAELGEMVLGGQNG